MEGVLSQVPPGVEETQPGKQTHWPLLGPGWHWQLPWPQSLPTHGSTSVGPARAMRPCPLPAANFGTVADTAGVDVVAGLEGNGGLQEHRRLGRVPLREEPIKVVRVACARDKTE